jgi:Protein of unknown function (DUF1059)
VRGELEKVLRCECGFEARAANEDRLAAEIQRHAREAHGMSLSRDEALLLTLRADLERLRIVETGSSEKETT